MFARLLVGAVARGVVVSAVGMVSFAHAQGPCPDPQWLGGTGIPGVGWYAARASTWWDPDGAGPGSPRLVIAGEFTLAGDINASRIASYDFATKRFAPMAEGLNGTVHALGVLEGGDLVAGGEFTASGSTPLLRLARWNGSAWSSLGDAPNAIVRSVLGVPGGDLIVAGDFTSIGSLGAGRIVRWSPAGGGTWSALGTGIDGPVRAVVRLDSGEIVGGGSSMTAGGAWTGFLAKWNGTSWTSLGSGLSGGVQGVFALHKLPNGDLLAGGEFLFAGADLLTRVGRWDAQTNAWLPLGTGITQPSLTASVRAISALSNGDVCVGGVFTHAGGVEATNVARWNGTEWSAMGVIGSPSLGSPAVYQMTHVPDVGVCAVGNFGTNGQLPMWNVAQWEESSNQWRPLGRSGTSNDVYAAKRLANDDMVLAGAFASVDGVLASSIAQWNPLSDTWSPLGSGIKGGQVNALTIGNDESLYAAGSFTHAGSSPASNIAKWKDGQWSPLGSGTSAMVLALATLPNGDIVAGGKFLQAGGVAAERLARWNGVAWSAFDSFGGNWVESLAVLPNGDLLVGGGLLQIGTGPSAFVAYIARWDGTGWSKLSTPAFPNGVFPTYVRALAVRPDGTFAIGGQFSEGRNTVMLWNGLDWQALAAGPGGLTVRSLFCQPNGDLIAGGAFPSIAGVQAGSIARWDGSQWHEVGGGLGGDVYGIVEQADGALLVVGDLSYAGIHLPPGGKPVSNLVRFGCPPAPPCEADCDQSGSLDIDDFICFQTLFAIGC